MDQVEREHPGHPADEVGGQADTRRSRGEAEHLAQGRDRGAVEGLEGADQGETHAGGVKAAVVNRRTSGPGAGAAAASWPSCRRLPVLDESLLRAEGDTVYILRANLACQWLVAIPLTFIAALVWDLPFPLVFVAINSEEIVKAVISGYRVYRRN